MLLINDELKTNLLTSQPVCILIDSYKSYSIVKRENTFYGTDMELLSQIAYSCL